MRAGSSGITTARDCTTGGCGEPPDIAACRRSSARLQHLVQLLRRRGLVGAVDCGELGRQAVQRLLVDLPLGEGLVWLAGVAVQVAYHLRDRDRVAGVDLLLVFLR